MNLNARHNVVNDVLNPIQYHGQVYSSSVFISRDKCGWFAEGRVETGAAAMENNVSQGPLLGLHSVAADATGPVRLRGNFMLVQGDFQGQASISKRRRRRRRTLPPSDHIIYCVTLWFRQKMKLYLTVPLQTPRHLRQTYIQIIL